MRCIHFVRRIAGALAAMACAMMGLVLAAPDAFAMRVPAPGGFSPAILNRPDPASVHTVVAGGMSEWEIAVISVGIALVASTITLVVDRARREHRDAVAPAT